MKNISWRHISFGSFLSVLIFAGGIAHAAHFSIVVIPDTQWYAENNPEIIDAQTQWVVDNRVAENIIYVAQLGDLKDDTTCDVQILPDGRTEWEVLDEAFLILEDPVTTGLADGIPYGVTPGNHDFDQVGGGCPNYSTERPLTGFNGVFGPGRFAGRPYYGGSFAAASNEHNYTLFSFAGIEFIAINLAYHENPSALPVGDPALLWASNLLAANPDRLGIVTSHFFLEEHTPMAATTLGTFGANIFDALDGNPNLFMMLSAHRRGEAWRVESRAGMDDVHILMSNYQDIQFPGAGAVDYGALASSEPGDSGLMRIMRFDTDTGIVDIETFAPPVPVLGRPQVVSSNFVADGVLMSRFTASNISLSFPVPILRPSVPILLDTSGSMAWSVDGVVGVPVEQRRITYAKEAAKAFLDLMVAVPANEGQADFGIATFPNHPSSSCGSPSGEVVTALSIANSANIATATSAGGTIDSDANLVTENGTPLLAGIDSAIGMFGVDDQNRSIILLSDGYHNCPSTVSAADPIVDSLVDNLNANDIRVFTVGFGEPGDIDNLLHRRLANDTTPAGASSQFFDVTADLGYDPSMPSSWANMAKPALDIAFKEILSSVMGLETAIDPVGSIVGGTSKSVDIAIGEHDEKIGVYLSWQTIQRNRLSFALFDSSGSPVTVRDRGVRIADGETYSILSVDQEFLKHAGRVTDAPWRMEISAGQIDPRSSESFQYSVLLDSDLKLHARTTQTDYVVGDTILLTAEIIEDGRRVTGLEDVHVSVSAPEDGTGNWLATNPVSIGQLAKIPAIKVSERLLPFQRKGLYLSQLANIPAPGKLAPQELKLFDDGSHGDVRAGDGRYTNEFENTNKQGVYSFYFQTKGKTAGGMFFSREQLVQTYLPVRATLATIFVAATELPPGDLRRVDIRVTPKDQFGNFVGPGNSGLIVIEPSTGRILGELRDNLDGSYSQTIELPLATRDRDVDLSISVDDVVKNTNLKTAMNSDRKERKGRHGFLWILLFILVGASLA